MERPTGNSWDVMKPMGCVLWDRTRPMETIYGTTNGPWDAPPGNSWDMFKPMDCVPWDRKRPMGLNSSRGTTHGMSHGTEAVAWDAPRAHSWEDFRPIGCVIWDRTRSMGAVDPWDGTRLIRQSMRTTMGTAHGTSDGIEPIPWKPHEGTRGTFSNPRVVSHGTEHVPLDTTHWTFHGTELVSWDAP